MYWEEVSTDYFGDNLVVDVEMRELPSGDYLYRTIARVCHVNSDTDQRTDTCTAVSVCTTFVPRTQE